MISFIFAGFLLCGSTAADIESTYSVYDRGGREANVFMRPLVEAGRPAIYGVQMGINTGVLWWFAKTDRRKFRWVVVGALAAGHTYAAIHNARQR